MKKNTTVSHSSDRDVKYYNPSPGIPIYANQRIEAETRIKDPASACFASCRYPIPSAMSSRLQSGRF